MRLSKVKLAEHQITNMLLRKGVVKESHILMRSASARKVYRRALKNLEHNEIIQWHWTKPRRGYPTKAWAIVANEDAD